MESTKQDFLLGLTVLVMVALLVGSFFFLMEGPLFKPETRQLVVHFEEGIARLKAGSPVLLRGAVDVGDVASVDLLGGSGRDLTKPIIVITAEIERDKITLFKDCRLTTSEGVIGGGGSLVILDVGTPERGVLPEDQPVDGEPPQSFQAAINQLSERVLGPGGLLEDVEFALDRDRAGSLMYKILVSLDDVNAMTGSLRRELTAGEQEALIGQLHSILDNVNQLTGSLREQVDPQLRESLLAQIHVMLTRMNEMVVRAQELVDESAPRLASALTHVESAARTLDESILGPLAAEFDASAEGTLLAKVHTSMDSVVATLGNVEAVSRQGREMIVLQRPALARTIGNLKAASETLAAGLNEIRTQPWRLLNPPTEAEKSRIIAFEAARQFAQAARRLDDVTTQLEALEATATDDGTVYADPATVERIRVELEQAFKRFEQAEAYLWQEMRTP